MILFSQNKSQKHRVQAVQNLMTLMSLSFLWIVLNLFIIEIISSFVDGIAFFLPKVLFLESLRGTGTGVVKLPSLYLFPGNQTYDWTDFGVKSIEQKKNSLLIQTWNLVNESQIQISVDRSAGLPMTLCSTNWATGSVYVFMGWPFNAQTILYT